MVNSFLVRRFEDYWKIIKGIKCDDDEMLFYRGVCDSSYEFIPGILVEKNVEEDVAYLNTIIEFPDDFDRKEHLDNLVKMQHYGVPTRLIDLTGNLLAALFFAVEQKPNTNGLVNVVKVKKKDILYYNSDRALMLSCLPLFSKDEKEEIKRFCMNHRGVITDQDIHNSNIMRRFLHEIRGEYPAFETAIVGNDLLNCFVVRTNKSNERIKIQNGAFIIFGLDDEGNKRKIENTMSIMRIEICSKSKKELLADLDRLNINTSTVYPGLERTAVYLRNKKLGWMELNR